MVVAGSSEESHFSAGRAAPDNQGMSTHVVDVVCIGLATRDTIARVPEHPRADGRVVAMDLQRAGGGPAATAAVALARLGHRVAFVGTVGDDAAGDEIRASLTREGVDVTGVTVVAGAR